jgi:uncharacterized membrane protein
MDTLDKYLKIAKKAVINPGEGDIEEKILKRLSNINEKDKKLLDDNFLDYLKKSNSRPYLISEDLKNNPGKYLILSAVAAIFFVLIFVIARNASKKNPGKA